MYYKLLAKFFLSVRNASFNYCELVGRGNVEVILYKNITNYGG